MDILTQVGTLLSGRWEVNFGELNTQPRLYTVKIAQSAWRRKSTATKFADKMISQALSRKADLVDLADSVPEPLKLVFGAGSAEGLMTQFRHQVEDRGSGYKWIGSPRIVLNFDEFRRFEKKAKSEGAVLLYAVNELYDSNRYDNPTKGSELIVRNAHLGFIANTTEETWRSLVDGHEMEDVGLTNRLFLVVSATKKRVPRPKPLPKEQLDPLLDELAELFTKLPPVEDDGSCKSPTRLELTSEAEMLWDAYYHKIPETKTTARLDAMGPRLMAILAFVTGKEIVDVEIVRAVIALLDHQQKVREAFQPILGNSKEAKLENAIDQAHKRHGALSKNQCRRLVNGNRFDSVTFDKVYEQYRVRFLKAATTQPGSRAERFERRKDVTLS